MKNEISRKLHRQYRKEHDAAGETREQLYKHLETLPFFGEHCECSHNSLCHRFGVDDVLCLDCGGYCI